MYSNETNNTFSIKDIILQFLFIVLFIFILIWLFPMKSDVKRLEKKIEESAVQGKAEATYNLEVLYDRIFNENVIAMKDAAKSYFTNERLPQKVGSKVKITLREMLDKKIILPFVDKKGNACDLDNSYVEITKYENEYVMKVNLKCDDQENYLLVYMGCYDYCKTTICEKKPSDVTKPVVYPSKKPDPKPTPKPTPKPDPKPEETGAPTCNLKAEALTGSYKNGVYTGNIRITFKDKTAAKNTKISSYGIGFTPIYNNSNNFDITKDGSWTVNGYVKASNGKTGTCSITVTKKTEAIPVKLQYQYKKDGHYVSGSSSTSCSSWSNWSDSRPSGSNIEIKTRTVTYQEHLYNKIITKDDLEKPIYEKRPVYLGNTEYQVCNKYSYVNSGKTVQYGNWEYAGLVALTSTPSATASRKYVPTGEKVSWYCGSTCSAGSYYLHKLYVKKPVNVSNYKYKCTSYSTVKLGIKSTRTIITGYEKKQEIQEVWSDPKKKTQYSYRSCSTSSNGGYYTSPVYTWSNSSWDQSLLNQGYYLTGNTRKA